MDSESDFTRTSSAEIPVPMVVASRWRDRFKRSKVGRRNIPKGSPGPEGPDPLLLFDSESASVRPAGMERSAPASWESVPLRASGSRWFRPLAVVAILLVAVAAFRAAGMLPSFRLFTAFRPDRPVPGQLTVSTDPVGAEVLIDGRSLGQSPVSVNVPAGAHVLTVRNGTDERVLPLNATSRGLIEEHLELKAKTEPVKEQPDRTSVSGVRTPAPPQSGWISIASPFDVDVRERGGLLGTSRMPKITLRAGRHRLQLVSSQLGYEIVREIDVVPGNTGQIQVVPPRGTLNVNASPWANVWLDGESLGPTPIANLRIPIGSHELILRHPDLGERRQDVMVGLQDVARVGVDFTK
jgi:hypothetical protein